MSDKREIKSAAETGQTSNYLTKYFKDLFRMKIHDSENPHMNTAKVYAEPQGGSISLYLGSPVFESDKGNTYYVNFSSDEYTLQYTKKGEKRKVKKFKTDKQMMNFVESIENTKNASLILKVMDKLKGKENE